MAAENEGGRCSVNDERELELTITADPRSVRLVRDLIDDFCHATPLSEQLITDIKIAVSEACSNVVRHAYTESGGPMTVNVKLSPHTILLSVTDYGRGLADGRSSETIDIVNGKMDGGLGIFIIRQVVDAMDCLSERNGTKIKLLKQVQ